MPRDAAYYRAHREAFTLALELGCTPKEAERKLALMRMRERHRALADRAAARLRPPPVLNGRGGTVIIDEAADFDGRDREPWMMRD